MRNLQYQILEGRDGDLLHLDQLCPQYPSTFTRIFTGLSRQIW